MNHTQSNKPSFKKVCQTLCHLNMFLPSFQAKLFAKKIYGTSLRSVGSDAHSNFRALGVIIHSHIFTPEGVDEALFARFFGDLSTDYMPLGQISHCPYLDKLTPEERISLVASMLE